MRASANAQAQTSTSQTLFVWNIAVALFLLAAGAGCAGQTPATPGVGSGARVTLVLGAFTTPREAYARIIPLFQEEWKHQTEQEVEFQESYLGSGAQSRAIVGGFEADIAALSLEADIDRIAKAGLLARDWREQPHGGMVTDSVVVLAVRKGNPKHISDWHDLTRSRLSILTPDPNTSGGAQWNIMAMYGAARRGFVAGYPRGDESLAREFLKGVFRNISALDKGARESIRSFEMGIGDVAITYENEVIVGNLNGMDYDYLLPRSTILVENPVAVVDQNVDRHGVRAAAEGFRDYLWKPEAQRVFAEFGFRSVETEVAAENQDRFPAVQDLFRISDLGGWSSVATSFFGENGVYLRLMEEVQRGKAR